MYDSVIQPNLQVSTGDQRGEINSSQFNPPFCCDVNKGWCLHIAKPYVFRPTETCRILTSKRHRISYVQHDISPSFPKATWNSNFLVRLGGIFQDSARINVLISECVWNSDWLIQFAADLCTSDGEEYFPQKNVTPLPLVRKFEKSSSRFLGW